MAAWQRLLGYIWKVGSVLSNMSSTTRCLKNHNFFSMWRLYFLDLKAEKTLGACWDVSLLMFSRKRDCERWDIGDLIIDPESLSLEEHVENHQHWGISYSRRTRFRRSFEKEGSSKLWNNERWDGRRRDKQTRRQTKLFFFYQGFRWLY